MERIGMLKTLRKIGYVFFVGLLLVGCGIRPDQRRRSDRLDTSRDSKAIGSDSLDKALADFNRGAALLEQYKYAEAARAFESVLNAAPDWTAARFNLGLAYFNLQVKPGAKSYLKLAREAFEAVLQSDPNHLHARFCLGLHHQYLGENEEALEYFRAVHEGDPEDPYVLYKYAETHLTLGSADDGVKLLEKVVALDPGFISAVYRLAIQYQRMRRRDEARSLFTRFKQLKDIELAGGTFTVLKAYGTVGKYYMALDADNLPLRPAATLPHRRIMFSPELNRLNAGTSVWEYSGAAAELPGVAAGDIDGDGDLDLCITAFDPDGSALLWRNDGAGRFSRDATLSRQGISPCFGDVDNDGDLDLWLGRAGADIYFENDGKGNFTKGQAAAVAGGESVTHYARVLDVDSDGDLDLLAFRAAHGMTRAGGALKPAGSSIYNNNRDGSFADIAGKLGLTLEKTPVAAVAYDDFDNDRDMDFVVFSAIGKETIVWVNDRAWTYRTLDVETTGLPAEGVLSATSGDPDKDGDSDLLIFTEEGIELLVNQGGFGFARHQTFSRQCGRLGGTGGQFADMDNDGDLDIVIADAYRRDGSRGPSLLINDWPQDRFVDAIEMDPGNLLSAIESKGEASCVVADFTGNGRCDILMAPIGEKPYLVENITPGGNWIEIDLRGTRGTDKKTRSNNSAIGARVEVKAGNISQLYTVGAPSGSVAMPPHRIHAGLGQHPGVDWLRITWPDAVLQAELELPAGQVMTIAELQRKVSSCPHLFAWDGSHFEFVSDFGGMGGIGYLAAPGVYGKPDPTEYLPIPNLKPRDGEYVFQVLEPTEEVVYFDQAKLIAVDHPLDTEVYPHEMMAIGIPAPPYELFCFKDTIGPVHAVDHRGTDVTENIHWIDRNYAGATGLDSRFTGFAEDHFVELDFGDRLKEVSPESRLVLFLYGSVEYAYSSTNFAASQAGLRSKAPSIHVLRDGDWVEIFHEVGYPAGIRHMMTLDVTGKVLPGDRRIRISSNMELYWDRIFIAPILEDVGLSAREAPVKGADLHFFGYPREYSPDGRRPNLFDYDNADRAVPWKLMEGNYTRYGEVTELLGEADDCYVVMARGDELTLRFSVDAFGPVPRGYRRSFVLKTDSFCKDMDLYSAYPDSVEPLPFHSMSNYPYGVDEKYPDDKKRQEYLGRFNTRRVGGPEN
ncbi:MAG: CRTAC1 family protein [Planctomycetota bacterium]|jgi:tetratricopeptide (TPR) repeat protein